MKRNTQPVFENAVVNTSIVFFKKTNTECKSLLSTKLHRKNNDFSLDLLVRNLKFADVKELKLAGRYPKISDEIERKILQKLLATKTKISDITKQDGKPIYYRTTGGRYFKIITNYSTGSTQEKELLLDSIFSDSVGAILSSDLFFWYYQIYSDNFHIKYYEMESFPIPINRIDNKLNEKIKSLYSDYLIDIEKNVNIRKTDKYANISDFKEYKIGKSKYLIDKIDDLICPLYGLTDKEINFIKNYEIEFRLSDDVDD